MAHGLNIPVVAEGVKPLRNTALVEIAECDTAPGQLFLSADCCCHLEDALSSMKMRVLHQ